MTQIEQFDYSKLPNYKVELHVHLDGSVRLTTLWEIAQKKGIKLPAETLEELFDVCRVKKPTTLEHFLKPFRTCIIPVIAGDAEVIERIAFEFCQDAARQKVLYCEVRYCPHSLSTIDATDENVKPLMPRNVVQCVNRGLTRGSAKFHITVRSILCCIRGRPEWSSDILQLCEEFKHHGVVGIDITGGGASESASKWSKEILELCEEFKHHGVVGIDVAGDEASEFASSTDIDIFQRASELGIHRTVHAGEAGPACNVKVAIDDMHAERIGHGYHVVDDDAIYCHAKDKSIHFECCPYSSVLTGSVSLGTSKHPIVRFAEDNVSFSINRDDPTLTQKTLDEELALLRGFGLKDVHFARANINAAMHCFLPEDEKTILLKQLKAIYGVSTDTVDQNEAVYILPKVAS